MLRASRDRSFYLPHPLRERVDLRRLATIAAACLSVGVALSGSLRREPNVSGLHELDETEPTNDQEQGRQEAGAGMDVNAVSAVSAASPPLTQSLKAIAAVIAVESSISAATAPLTAASTRDDASQPAPAQFAVQRGRVSYHCDAGDLSAAKRGKCPRDRALEARVWRVLAHLPACRDATDALGRAELRLRFAPDATTRTSLSAPTIAQSLNLRAVSQCVAAELSTIKSTRQFDRFELDLSFGLIRRN